MPCSNQQLLTWIDNGSVKTQEVALLQARPDPDCYFAEGVGSQLDIYYTRDKPDEERLQRKVVIFWCNNASANSPYEAEKYFKWLKENHPKSKQQVMVLQNGINKFARYLKGKKAKMLFEEYIEKEFRF